MSRHYRPEIKVLPDDCGALRYNAVRANSRIVAMAEIHVEEHSSPIETPQQLVSAVLLAFAVPIALIVMLTQLVTSQVNGER